MNTPAQLDLEFNAPASDGYDVWQWEEAQAVKRIGELWNVPLNAWVRVTLRNLDQEFTGRLKLVQRPSRPDGKEPLSLSVGGMPFLHTEIESCVVTQEACRNSHFDLHAASRTG